MNTATPLPEPAAAALDGLRVLDFSIMMAGPYAARLLADLGADVIKIEPPEGDDMRLRAPLRDGCSAYVGQLNAGKRSLALDLKRPDAIALVKRLVAECDVVIENFRPGVMDRLGLGAELLRAINPRLVVCSISGYGQTGPAAERAAYAMIVHATSGFDRTLMRYAGDRDRPASGAVFVADMLGAVFAFGAIQAALVQRARTGIGQVIDVALMDSMLNLLVYELQEAQFPVKTPRPTYGPVRAADGDLLVVPITPRNFAALCEVTGLIHCAELAADGTTPPEMGAISKVYSGELMERYGEAALELLGARAALSQGASGAASNGRFEQQLRHALMWVISIGTNEIQRSLIAQRGLGLPR